MWLGVISVCSKVIIVRFRVIIFTLSNYCLFMINYSKLEVIMVARTHNTYRLAR